MSHMCLPPCCQEVEMKENDEIAPLYSLMEDAPTAEIRRTQVRSVQMPLPL